MSLYPKQESLLEQHWDKVPYIVFYTIILLVLALAIVVAMNGASFEVQVGRL